MMAQAYPPPGLQQHHIPPHPSQPQLHVGQPGQPNAHALQHLHPQGMNPQLAQHLHQQQIAQASKLQYPLSSSLSLRQSIFLLWLTIRKVNSQLANSQLAPSTLHPQMLQQQLMRQRQAQLAQGQSKFLSPFALGIGMLTT